MDQRRDLRISDRERQEGVDRLRLAHDEGRLSLLEYDHRVASAYQAVTYGELAKLLADLPVPAAPAQLAPTMPVAPAGPVAAAPRWVRKLWVVWGTFLLFNVTAWILVDINNHGREDFWPRWLLIPTVVVAGITAGAIALRRGPQR